MCKYVVSLSVCMCVKYSVCESIQKSVFGHACVKVCVCAYVCLGKCVCVNVCTCVFIYEFMNVREYVCVYTRECVSVHVHYVG